MAKHKDRIPGGLADRSKPSDFSKKQLKMGTAVEREHVGKKAALAREIAMDHLKEFPKYYTALKKMEKGLEKSKNEAAMDVGYFVGLLENLRFELSEAGPPPIDPSARRAAGMKPLGGKDDETSKALSSVRELSKQSAADAKKAKTPPRLPKEVRQAKSDKARNSPEGLARQAHANKKKGEMLKNIAANKPAWGTKGLGIKRSFSVHSAGKSDDDESKMRGKMVRGLGKVVGQRAAHGESTIRAIYNAILEAMKPVKATGSTSGYLPGVHAKPPPTPGTRKHGEFKAKQKLRVAGKKSPDETSQALSVVRKLSQGGKVESFASTVSAIRSAIFEGGEREFGGPKLSPRERKAKGLPGRSSSLSSKMRKIWR